MSPFDTIALPNNNYIDESWPTGLWSDEPEMESDLHLLQIMVLLQCLKGLWRERNDYYAAGNMTLYYSPAMVKNRDFRGPDFLVVKDVENYPRRSWTVWEEGWKFPNLVIEILSDTTAKVDRTTKKDLYAELGIEEYFWFDPVTLEFVGFSLVNGDYQRIEPDDRGYCWSQTLDLWLGRSNRQLRYFSADGQLIPTPEEECDRAILQADREMRRADRAISQADRAISQADRADLKANQAMQQVEQAILRADRADLNAEQLAQERDRLAKKLRELGIDPDSL